jgi:hypothetical protein
MFVKLINDTARMFDFHRESLATKIEGSSSPELPVESSRNIPPGYRKPEYPYFTDKYTLDKPPVSSWVTKENTLTFCDGKIAVYGNMFAMLNNVTMFPKRRANIDGQAKGGEEIREVLNQNLDKEKYMFNNDFLEINCVADNQLVNHAGKLTLFNSLKVIHVDNTEHFNNSVDARYAIAIRREDYANLHNWIRNIYNTFLAMIHFKIQPSNITVIFMDGHPVTELDKAWTAIYGAPLRVGRMENPQTYQNFILGIDESQGPVSDYLINEVPYLEEFRSFVLSQFNLPDEARFDCSRLRITVIIRRNAVYHPRNVQGNVGRKIFNEATLINDLIVAFPTASVKPVLMESLPMRLQLKIISQSDVLIGMHGAGMSHVMFLPRHAAILEMFSKDFKVDRPWYRCYNSIAKWRGLKYDSWENFDSSREMPADFTVIPTEIIVQKTAVLVKTLCNAG